MLALKERVNGNFTWFPSMWNIFPTSVSVCFPFQFVNGPMNSESAEVIKVAIEPLQPAELPKMVDGLRQLWMVKPEVNIQQKSMAKPWGKLGNLLLSLCFCTFFHICLSNKDQQRMVQASELGCESRRHDAQRCSGAICSNQQMWP